MPSREENNAKIKQYTENLISLVQNQSLKKSDKDFDKRYAEIKKNLEAISDVLRSEANQKGYDFDLKFYTDKENINNMGYANLPVYYNDYFNKFVKDDKTKDAIYFNEACLLKKLENENPNSRTLRMLKSVSTIIHESRHIYQEKQIEKDYDFSCKANTWAKEMLLSNLDEEAPIYDTNYKSLFHEVDARDNAYNRLMEIYKDDRTRKKFIAHTRLDCDDKMPRSSYLAKFDKDDYSQDSSFFINQHVDRAVKKHPEILNYYKCLQHEYNKDGSKKSVSQLIEDFNKNKDEIMKEPEFSEERKNNYVSQLKHSYFELLGNVLHTATPEEINKLEQTFGIGNSENSMDTLYSELRDYYTNEAISQVENLHNFKKDPSLTPEQIAQFDLQEKIISDKYNRLIGITSSLEQHNFHIQQNIINGVDIAAVSPVKPEDPAKKSNDIKEMLKVYSKLESDDDFYIRNKTENKNISQVLNSVDTLTCSVGFMNTFEKGENGTYSKDQVKAMMRILKSADNLTIKGGKNYLEEFSNVPFVHDIFMDMQKDPTYLSMKKQAENSNRAKSHKTALEKDKDLIDTYSKGLSSTPVGKHTSVEAAVKYYSKSSIKKISPKGNSVNSKLTYAIANVLSAQRGYPTENEAAIDRVLKKGDVIEYNYSKDNSLKITLDDLNKFLLEKGSLKAVEINGNKYPIIPEAKEDNIR